MSSVEQSITGFIIKSQDLGEADLLLTFFSAEQGKVRTLVKSAKKMTSKLSGHLQPYILVEVVLVGDKGLPKIISVQPLAKYPSIINNQLGMQVVLAMQELVLRALADEQPNSELFEIYHLALKDLGKSDIKISSSNLAIVILTKFYTEALLSLGFSPRLLAGDQLPEQIFFSMQNGKFFGQREDSGDYIVSLEAYQLYKSLINQQFSLDSDSVNLPEGVIVELLTLLTKFASYQLERELRATLFFTVI